MLIGGHVSVAKGIELAPKRGHDITATVIQMFASSPRSFKTNDYTAAQLAQTKQFANEFGIEQIFLHGVYLINLASIDLDYRQASIRSLSQYLAISDAIDGVGVIFHPGFRNTNDSDEAIRNIILSCTEILSTAPKNQLLLIENSAGSSGQLCSTIDELAQIATGVSHPNLRFCIDTQHLFAAGFDLRTPEGITTFVETFDKVIGWDKVVAIHCNDSKTNLGSHLDRHENIGKGKLGLEAFRGLLNDEHFRGLPFITEVPGLADKGPDKPNIDLLRSLIKDS